jgi:tetratricopeptide (TPR) repeat protein
VKLDQYTKYLAVLFNAHRKLICIYCGTKTAAVSEMCMCSNCENIARYDSRTFSSMDPMLESSLRTIQETIAEERYDDAIAEYEKLEQYKDDPALLYAKALAYIKYSNHENAKISYDRSGFMEDNAAVMERSLSLASTAKALLAKSIAFALQEIAQGNGSLSNTYALLLAQLKFGELKGAKESLNEIEKLGNPLVYNYALMLFESHMKNYEKMMEHADEIIRSDDVLVNAFFYAGLALLKLGRRDDAEKLLAAVGGMFSSGTVPALIEEILSSEAIWE